VIFSLFILLLIPHLIFGVEVKDFKIAIFWNSGTEIVPYETPVGYDVASPDTTSAPEIGKSALKLFLSSLDPAVGYDGSTTLDTADIKEEVRDNSGVVEGASPAVLPNARIFNVYDPVTLEDIRNSFDGETPEVIAVINAGGQVDYAPLKQLLYEASLAEIGILLVGSASTSFAVAIDELAVANGNDKFFAVKGIQKSFNVESYKGSLLFDFDLTGDITPDSVVMEYENDLHFIRKISGVSYDASDDSYDYEKGDTIYMQSGDSDLHADIVVKHHYGQFVISNAKAQSVIEYDSYDPAMNSGIFYNSAVLGINGSSELITTENISADTIISESATNNVIAANSKIKEAGTAVAFGDEVPRAWIRVKTGSNYGSSVSYKKEQSVVVPGTGAYGDGSAYIDSTSTSSEFHMWSPSKSGADGSDATDYTAFYKSNGSIYPQVPDSSGLYRVTTGDTVFVHSYTAAWDRGALLGSFIVDSVKNAPEGYRFTFTDDFKINNSVIYEKDEVFEFISGYEMRYPAKGYDSLSIDIKNISTTGNSEIFTKIFGEGASNLSGNDSTILFKDWEPNGRIQSAAEIWAVDTAGGKVAQFSDWYGAGKSFDSTKIYFGRFGQQVARGANEFFYLKENGGSNGFDKTMFNTLPDASNPRFADKEYYALSVIQRKHQRLAIVGYEPQFLEDTELSKNILRDIFTWAAIDDSRMPVGKIQIVGSGDVYNPNDQITRSVTSLRIILDYSQKDAAIYTAGATVSSGAVMNQAGTPITIDWSNPTITKDAVNQIDTLVYDITGLLNAPVSIDSLYITGIEITGDAPFSSTVDSTLFRVVGNVSVDKELPDVTLIEDAADTTVADLDTVFVVQDAAALTYTVESTDSTKVIGIISNDSLILDAQDDATGTADIIVKADDGNGNVSFDTLTVTFTAVNDAPVVSSPITDVVVDEDAADTAHVDLNAVFSDVDGDDLTFTVTSSSSNSIVTPTIADLDSMLTLSFAKDSSGIDTIIVSATDGDTTVVDTFFVTVNSEEDSPIIAETIDDVTTPDDGSDTTFVDLDSIFVDGDGDDLNFTIVSNDSGIVIGTVDSEGMLTLDVQDGKSGNTTMVVTADDGNGNSVSDTFAITIPDYINDTPDVSDSIPDVTVDEDAADTVLVDLDTIFTDSDGDELTYSVVSNNEDLVKATIDEDGNLTLDYQDDTYGTTEVIVTADDGSLTTSDTIIVTVNPIDDGPVVSDSIPDITTVEDSKDTVISDLDDVFEDVDGDTLTYTAISQDESLVIATVDEEGNLTLDYQDDKTGSTLVIVTADDGTTEVHDTISVTVSDENDGPSVNDTIPDVEVDEESDDTTIVDLDTVFTDIDGDELTYSVTSDDSTIVIGAVDTEGVLTLDFQEDGFGTTRVIVTADDGTSEVHDTLVVTVNGLDDIPKVNDTIPDVIVDEDSDDTVIVDLDDVFEDVDGDDLTYSVISQDETLVIATVDNNGNLTLDYQDDQSGSTLVIVTADDGTTEVHDTLTVTVNEIADDPEVNDTITDVIIIEDSNDTTIVDLDTIFFDVDGDSLTYSAVSKDSTIVIGIIDSEGVLTLDLQDDGFGTTLVIVTADDGTSQVHDTIEVTVDGIQDAPLIVDTIPDVDTPDDGSDTTVVDLDDIFDDVDGDTLTFITISKDSTLVIPIVDKEGNLILDVQEGQTGKTIVIVTADDGKGHTVSDTVLVTIDIAVTPQDKVVDFFWGHIIIPEMFETVITPNPAPPSANSMQFIFSSEEADVIELAIFDAVGEKVAESDMSVAWDGTAEFNWDLRNLRDNYRAKSYAAMVLFKKNGRIITTERHMIGLRK